MYYNIFRNNILVRKVHPDSSSQLSQKKQAEDIVRLSFSLEDYVEIQIGDYIVYNSEKYYINTLPDINEVPNKYSYDCIFEGSIHRFQNTMVFLDTPKEDGSFYRDYKFPLTGTAQTFLDFIVTNLNRNGWSVTAGDYKVTDSVTIDFNNFSVIDAITWLAQELEFDWYFEDNVLHFDKKDNDLGLLMRAGRLSGFTQLDKLKIPNSEIHTVVYGYGSMENLPPRIGDGITYNGDTLTENRLKFDGEYASDGTTRESKLSANTDLYGSIETVKEFDYIYPEFTGMVADLYDDVYSFYDYSIDFDINDSLLFDIPPKITWLTGNLIGQTFNISFDNDTQLVTMEPTTETSGEYPNETIFCEVGDQYKLHDIALPESYITAAATRLEEATQEYLDDNSSPQEMYEGIVDEEYINTKSITLAILDTVRVVSGVFGIDNSYEITELTRSITEPDKYTIKFGTVLPKNLLSLLDQRQFENKQDINNITNNYATNNSVTNLGENITWQTF